MLKFFLDVRHLKYNSSQLAYAREAARLRAREAYQLAARLRAYELTSSQLAYACAPLGV